MKKYISQNEKLSTIEEVLYNHSYDEDTDLIVRTGYSPVFTLIVGIVIFGIASLIAI